MTRDEKGFLAFAFVFVLLTAACSVSYVYPHDRAHPELDNWFMRLQSKKKVSCCEGSEALRIEDADWDSKDGHYRVRLEGEWVDVPDEAVIEEPNKAGQTLVWPWRVNGKLDHVRCFFARVDDMILQLITGGVMVSVGILFGAALVLLTQRFG